MTSNEDLQKARRETKAIYQRQAKRFAKDRTSDGREEVWLWSFTERIPSGGAVLDIGCGTGEPIAAWLIAEGYKVTGIDYSAPMLAIARQKLPGATWVLSDMRDLRMSGPFDGIISWHGSFHLGQDEQRGLIPKLAELLAPSGALMLTIGPAAGEVTGTVGGETVYHASLDPSEYRSLLELEGFTEVMFEEGGNEHGGPYVLLARR